ncbi:hypothetical protein [Rhodococcus opacus]|uniref:hypothetical protein n=1 Tax=Rhodococcus opacus TaxID=37919 RepID=UPI002952CA74|nr:hypothetical protein [Rhodococcus opacus]
MSSTGAADQVMEHLTALDDAVSGLLDADLSAVSDSDVVLIMQQLEKSLRRAGAVSLRLIVESAERLLPATLGCNSLNTGVAQRRIHRHRLTDARVRCLPRPGPRRAYRLGDHQRASW